MFLPEPGSNLIGMMMRERSDVDDKSCGGHYFSDQAFCNESLDSSLESSAELGPDEVPGLPCNTFCCFVVGRQTVAKERQSEEASNAIHIAMAVIRLPEAGSDILLVLNAPIVINPDSTAAVNAGSGQRSRYKVSAELLKAMLRSFVIKDFGLFGA
eukprot:gene15265-21347_t